MGGGGGERQKTSKVGASEEAARVWVRYKLHLPAELIQDGENSKSLLEGMVLPTLHGQIICKNWHLCGECLEECEHKNTHVPTLLGGGDRHL